ncbi:unnamed protein product [marine sediment metagenome]|uniref:Uncharacterized protein n=1 Tax=marine sediment metagenome TaxID=412755 RepID=X1HCZ4_9ZZZZ
MTDQVQKPYTISYSFSVATERRYCDIKLVSVHVINESIPIERIPEEYLREKLANALDRKFNEGVTFPFVDTPLD